MRVRAWQFLVLATALAAPAVASVHNANDAVHVTTTASADTVTVGQRFTVRYGLTFGDTLAFIQPGPFEPGTCRVLDHAWQKTTDGVAGTATVLAVSIDSVYVPPQVFDFVAPSGDTLRAWSDPIYLSLHYLSAESEDLRPLKQQWTLGPNWVMWILLGVGALALAAALVWWIRKRRARHHEEPAPEVRLPPDVIALTELERVAAMGLPAKGEFKTFYTLVVDAVRRYVEARFGVEAMDRTTYELLDDLTRHGRYVEGLGALLDEADLVKFAKFKPDTTRADAALGSAREIVVATTPRVVNDTKEREAVR